jgi:hypothetical protein
VVGFLRRRCALLAGQCALLAGQCALPAAASAKDPAVDSSDVSDDEPSQEDKDTARLLVTEGDNRFEREDYDGALRLYLQAYRRVRVPTVGLAVAKTEAALGMLLEARETALEVVQLPKKRREPSVFGQARTEASSLARQMSRRIPSVTITLSPADVEARMVFDNGKPAPASTEARDLDPGRHHVVVTASGYYDLTAGFDLAEGESQSLSLALKAIPKSSAPPREGPIADGRSAPVAPEAERKANAARTRGYVALGIAGAGAAVGTVTGILAFQTKPDCAQNLCAPEQASAIRQSKTFGTAANIGFGVGLVAGVYGLYELLANGSVSSSSDSEHKHTVAIAPSRGGGAGLTWSGEF